MQKIKIATGKSRKELKWCNIETTWEDFVKGLKTPSRTGETCVEYKRLSKSDKDEIKDVGGFVGGHLKQGRRKNESVLFRSLMTLDLDYATKNWWEEFTMLNDYACVMYSTHSHTAENPRYRLLIPISRTCSPDEYEAVARRITGDIGIEMFDATTYEPARLMYWPSCSRDAEFVCESQDGAWLNPDDVLKTYPDWKDCSEWPKSKSQVETHKKLAQKQGEPCEKPGMIGLFNRAYTIEHAIETFLSDIYTRTETDGRYTYVKGSSTQGLITYDSKFAYSHHGTDPTCGVLCNAFDLVRLHKFGALDEDTGAETAITKLYSYKAMVEFAGKDSGVISVMQREREALAKLDFSAPVEDDPNWQSKLVTDDGKVKQTIDNIKIILENDLNLKNAFWYNEFSGRMCIVRTVPWRKIKDNRDKMYEDADDAGLRHYLETVYKITAKQKIADALSLCYIKNSYHPVREYLNKLVWDGISRAETLFIDYLGAEDNSYTRAVTRKILVAAVARVYTPGIKFDNMLTLVGPQGIGKSYLLSRLGMNWFNDSLTGVDKGKDSYEQLQGYWIIEMSELNAIRKKDAEDIKGFLSKTEDVFRVAYGKHTACFPRQCVFFGTTNSNTFLSDPTGNRRFWVVDVGKNKKKLSPFGISSSDIDMVWAESKELFEQGEKLYLEAEEEKQATVIQKSHSEDNPKIGIVAEFLEQKLSQDWYEKSVQERKMFLFGGFTQDAGLNLERTEICIAEIWSECFGKDKVDMKRIDVNELHSIMQQIQGWESVQTFKNFGEYGRQRLWYSRKKDCNDT